MKRSLVFIFILLTLFIVKVDAAILWQENYDGMSTSWDCANTPSGGQMTWTVPGSCSNLTVGGVNHYCGEITDRGLSGKALTMWRNVQHQGIGIQYTGAATTGKLHYNAYNIYHLYLFAGSYSTGTITSFSGTTVTGNGTSWLANVHVGDFFRMTSNSTSIGCYYRVATVVSDTQLTTTTSFACTSSSGNYIVDNLAYDIYTQATAYNTLQKLVDYINTLPDWSAEIGAGVDAARFYHVLSTLKIADCKTSEAWLQAQYVDGYCGYPDKILSTAEFNQHNKEIFARWYMKFPVGFEAYFSTGETFKLTRARFGITAGAWTTEFYFDVKGAYITTGNFSFYWTKEGPVRRTALTLTQLGVMDGNWHCYELNLKMNSATGVSDGAMHFWIDGVEKQIDSYPNGLTNWNFGFSASEYFEQLPTPGIGNLTGGYFILPDDAWYAVDFDYFVVSTTYIGPLGGSSGYTNYGTTSRGATFR
jgi:hypothetical protein